VGGYLAFIGWFCGLAGVGVMAGTSEVTLQVVFSEKLIFILPGVLGGFMVYTAATKLRHMAALPVSIIIEILLFYVILWATGTSVAEATSAGWIRKMDPPQPWYHTWDYLRFDIVDWSVLPALAVTEIGMIFVVALSSSLDVAAIELELRCPLNYNHELNTVGLSNIVSGLTGGYTGSYIFSQTIFTMRSGIRSRLVGYVLAMCQVAVVVIPFPILSYVPNFFFGSLLSMICIDLMYEWLIAVRHRLCKVEYMICLTTFISIQLLGVEYGILAGILIHYACKRAGLELGITKFSSYEQDDDTDSLNDLDLKEEGRASNGTSGDIDYGAIRF
jgi:sulfate permease, SulP family